MSLDKLVTYEEIAKVSRDRDAQEIKRRTAQTATTSRTAHNLSLLDPLESTQEIESRTAQTADTAQTAAFPQSRTADTASRRSRTDEIDESRTAQTADDSESRTAQTARRRHTATRSPVRGLHVDMPIELYYALDQYAFINRLEKKDAVVQAIEAMLSRTAPTADTADTAQTGSRTAPTASRTARTAIHHDFDLIDDCDDINIIIIREYAWLTGKQFGASASDRPSWEAVKHINVDHILVGMLQTTFAHRKNKNRSPISSFAFFTQQILSNEEEAKLGSLNMPVQQYIQYVRSTLKKFHLVPDTWK